MPSLLEWLVITGIIYLVSKIGVAITNSEVYDNWSRSSGIFFGLIVPAICYGIFYVARIAFFIVPMATILFLALTLLNCHGDGEGHHHHPHGH